jgi:hypothetical protein
MLELLTGPLTASSAIPEKLFVLDIARDGGPEFPPPDINAAAASEVMRTSVMSTAWVVVSLSRVVALALGKQCTANRCASVGRLEENGPGLDVASVDSTAAWMTHIPDSVGGTVAKLSTSRVNIALFGASPGRSNDTPPLIEDQLMPTNVDDDAVVASRFWPHCGPDPPADVLG